jgi:hypothetical protein
VGLPSTYILSLAVIGTNIFAGTTGGVFLSTNNGTNWTKVNNGLTNTSIYSFAISGTNIFAGTGSGVFLSMNFGTNWIQLNNRLTNTYIVCLAVSGTDIFAGTDGAGVWKRPLSELVGFSKEINDLPQKYNLYQNYPNPFNPVTVISYSLSSASNVKLTIYNTLGQAIKIIENGFKNAGKYSINFNATELPSGTYLYKIETRQFSQIKKMMLLK